MLSGSTAPSNIAQRPVDLRVVAAVSLLLSLWLILIDPVINRDAIIYLRTADAYLRDGLLASFALFDRPFLSIMIAWLHQITGLSLLHSGLIFSALFYALLSTTFVSITRLIGGNRRVQLFAAIVILSHPMIAYGRDSILRDPPFWAFSLLAFRTLVLYVRRPLFKYQLQWFIFVGIASVFRFEGFFFVLFAPMAVFLTAKKAERMRLCLRLLALPLVAIFSLGVAVVSIQSTYLPDSQLFTNIAGYIYKLMSFPQVFSDISFATGEALLVFTAKDDATLAAIAGLAAILLVNLCRAVMWPYLITLIWGFKKKATNVISKQDRNLLNAHLMIGIAYLGMFTLLNRFMLERYCHIITIFLALYLPFILNSALSPSSKRVTKFLAILLLIGMSIDVLGNSSYKKAYIKSASDWIIENTPEGSSITSNSRYIAYFSNREHDWRNPKNSRFSVADLKNKPAFWKNSDYLIVRVKPFETEEWQKFLHKHALTELKVFPGENQRKLVIVETATPKAPSKRANAPHN